MLLTLWAVVPHALRQLEVNLLFGWVQGLAGRAGWTSRATRLPSLSRLICSSQWVPECSIPELWHSEPGLCPGRWSWTGLAASEPQPEAAAAMGPAPSPPWLLLREGLHKTTRFTVLCWVIACFGRAAVPGAGAVPGQARSQRHRSESPLQGGGSGSPAGRSSSALSAARWANTSTPNKLRTK